VLFLLPGQAGERDPAEDGERKLEAMAAARRPCAAPPSASLLLAAHRIKVKLALFNEIANSGEDTRSAAESRRT
jgi:hypothetical protein